MASKTISVPATFDDQLESLISRIKAEGWDKKYSIDLKTLDASLKTQRAQKTKDQELKQAYTVHHKIFVAEQGTRYQQYMEALSVLRGAHRNKPEILKSLEGYKRPGGGKKRKPPAK